MDNKGVKALLISNSKVEPLDYFEHVREAIKDFLGEPNPENHIAFVPFAEPDINEWDNYAKGVAKFFESIGHKCVSVHNLQLNTFSRQNDFLTDPKLTAVFVGGGETFCLLDEIRRNNMDDTLAHRVKNGLKYIGSSAGSVLAGPTIMTTNDNPIAFPRGTRTKEFNALNIINFQIKPHYWHGKLREDYNGETQEQRIKKYHVRNSYPVVALPEGSFLRVEGENVMLKGDMAARYFEKGAEPEVWPVNTVRFFPSFEKRG